MSPRRVSLVLLPVITLAACDVVPQRYQLAAEPLMPVPDTNPASLALAPDQATKQVMLAYGGTNTSPLQKVNILVQDSQTKCSAFVNSMFTQAAGTGLLLDVLSTASSALATVFTPVAATHAFSAASTIFSGTRTSITAEYLNSLTISHISQAIQTTYGTDMAKYIAYLNKVDPGTVDPYAERTTILSYHAECALAPAEGSIGAALQPASPAASGGTNVAYSVGTGETAAAVAAALARAINANANFAAAGVSAAANGAVITFTMATPVTLTPSVTPAGAKTTVTYKPGPPATLTIGTPRTGDSITLSLGQNAAGTPSPLGGSATTAVGGAVLGEVGAAAGPARSAPHTAVAKPGAAVPGQNPATK